MHIVPCILFDGAAEEAMNFYLDVFPGAEASDVLRAGAAGPGPKGALIAATLELAGNRVILLNGPAAADSMRLSLFVACETQAEIDRLWDRLCSGGKPIQCGWLTDRFGVTWQIVPARLMSLLQDPDPARAGRAMQAMMRMTKLDMVEIEHAAQNA